MAEYNPYDLIVVRIEGVEIDGRPYEFDSQPANNQTMQNEFGNYVKPTHISTVCPQCGQGINVENIQLPEPPFPVIDWVCPNCSPSIDPPVNAFMNPLDAGRIESFQLDPLLHDPNEQVIVDDPEETVADRLAMVDGADGADGASHSTSALLEDDSETDLNDESLAIEQPKEPSEESVVEEPKKTKKKAAKKTKKKATKKATKKSKGDAPPQPSESAGAPPEVQETPSLATEDRPIPKLEPAEGMSEEKDLDDLVDDE